MVIIAIKTFPDDHSPSLLLLSRIRMSIQRCGTSGDQQPFTRPIQWPIMAFMNNGVCFCFPGGGFHHCSGDRGGGFCAYADITLAIKVGSAERKLL